MRHCSMTKSVDNPDQQRSDRRMPWRPSLKCWWISGFAQEALPSSEGIYVHSSYKIYVQKLQRRIAFHTGFECEGPSRLGIQH